MPKKVIAVHSYRGGTGKSNLVANLATLMALQGNRVGIIDADIQSPGIHNIFDLGEDDITHTLNDYLWNRQPIQDTACDVSAAAGVSAPGKLLLIPSSVNPDEIARVLSEGYNVSQLNEGIRELIEVCQLNYLLIDTHPGLSRETFLSMAMANILLLVLRPDRQDFQGTAVIVDLARQLRVPQVMLVLNKVLTDFDFADLKRQVEATYQAPAAAIFPVATELMKLGSNGLFCQEYPDHPWTVELRQLLAEIIEVAGAAVVKW
jgi:MinD-like ATPase involved in chromosome partitioning or flagellar assembly